MNNLIEEIEEIESVDSIDNDEKKDTKKIGIKTIFDLILRANSATTVYEYKIDNDRYLRDNTEKVHKEINDIYIKIEDIVKNNKIDLNEPIPYVYARGCTILFYVDLLYYPDIMEKAVDLFVSNGANINYKNNNSYCFRREIKVELFNIFNKYPINIDDIYYEKLEIEDDEENDDEEEFGRSYDVGIEFEKLNNIYEIITPDDDEDDLDYKYEEPIKNYITREDVSRDYTFREYIEFMYNYINKYNLHNHLIYHGYDDVYELKNYVDIHISLTHIKSKSKSAAKKC